LQYYNYEYAMKRVVLVLPIILFVKGYIVGVSSNNDDDNMLRVYPRVGIRGWMYGDGHVAIFKQAAHR